MSNRELALRRRQGGLFVVSAPSGTGKTSLCQALVSLLPNLRHSVSYTTRAPRGTEVAGRDYSFVEPDTFRAMIQEGAFLEWAEVYGQCYGTPREPLRQWRAEGIDVILDIDPQGAAQVRQQDPDAVLIYVLPPSWDVLRRRLENRRSESSEEIAKRLQKAKKEVQHYSDYKYLIINNDFKAAVRNLEAIVLAERSLTATLDQFVLEQALWGQEGES